MEMEKAKPLSLKRRCMGPRAVSIATLIRRADAAVENIVRDFSVFARSRLEELRGLARAALADSQDAGKWAALRSALRDLQTSSGMAGASWIARYAGSLHAQLAQREAGDRHLPQLLELHLDAIGVAASGAASQTALAELGDKLERAALALRS